MSYVTQMRSMGVLRPQNVQQQYGISAESFNDIQRKLDYNAQRREAQRTAQRTVIKQAKEQPAGQLTFAESELLAKMKEALQYQAVQFDRFRELTDRKFTTLSKDLLDVTMQLKEAKQVIFKLKDKEDVAIARAKLYQYQQGDAPAVSRPIDRNGVCPADVQIETIFNCSGKRF